jgi:hypothetical protein
VIPRTIESLVVGVGMALLACIAVLQPIWRGAVMMPVDDEEIEAKIAEARVRS